MIIFWGIAIFALVLFFISSIFAQSDDWFYGKKIKKIIGDEEVITCRPADNIKPELEKLKAECAQYVMQDEDVLSYALFDQVAVKFFEERKLTANGLDKNTDTEN